MASPTAQSLGDILSEIALMGIDKNFFTNGLGKDKSEDSTESPSYGSSMSNMGEGRGRDSSSSPSRVNKNVARDVKGALVKGGMKTLGKVAGVTTAAMLSDIPSNAAIGLGLQMGLGPSAVAGLMGNVASSAMGIEPNGWATGGFGLLGSLVGGPIGGALGSAFGSVAWDAIKDWGDWRSEEYARDALEDNLGYVSGRQTYRGYEHALTDMGIRSPLTRGTEAWNTALNAALTNQYGPEQAKEMYNDYSRFANPVSVDTQFGTISMDLPSVTGLSMMGSAALTDSPEATTTGGPFGRGYSSMQDAAVGAMAGADFGGRELTGGITTGTGGVYGTNAGFRSAMAETQQEQTEAAQEANAPAEAQAKADTQTQTSADTSESNGAPSSKGSSSGSSSDTGSASSSGGSGTSSSSSDVGGGWADGGFGSSHGGFGGTGGGWGDTGGGGGWSSGMSDGIGGSDSESDSDSTGGFGSDDSGTGDNDSGW